MGMRLSPAKRFVFAHNDMDSLEKQAGHASKYVLKTGGGILVITEGVFGMAGDLGNIPGYRRKKARFRLPFVG